jgi:hypothetical protein
MLPVSPRASNVIEKQQRWTVASLVFVIITVAIEVVPTGC